MCHFISQNCFISVLFPLKCCSNRCKNGHNNRLQWRLHPVLCASLVARIMERLLWLYMDKDTVIELFFIVYFIVFKNLIYFDHLICFYVLYSFSHLATFREQTWVELRVESGPLTLQSRTLQYYNDVSNYIQYNREHCNSQLAQLLLRLSLRSLLQRFRRWSHLLFMGRLFLSAYVWMFFPFDCKWWCAFN